MHFLLYAISGYFKSGERGYDMTENRKIAAKIIERLKNLPTPKKAMLVFIVEGNESAEIFMRQKRKLAKKLGIDFKVMRFFHDAVTHERLLFGVQHFSRFENIGGVMIEMPLPETIKKEKVGLREKENTNYSKGVTLEPQEPLVNDTDEIIGAIPCEKDMDVLRDDCKKVQYPSVQTIRAILRRKRFPLKGKRIVVVGRGNRIGLPIYRYFKILRSRFRYANLNLVPARNLDDYRIGEDDIKKADLLVVGTQIPDILSKFKLKENAVVIDFNEKGIGPILTAYLFANFYVLNGCLDPQTRI